MPHCGLGFPDPAGAFKWIFVQSNIIPALYFTIERQILVQKLLIIIWDKMETKCGTSFIGLSKSHIPTKYSSPK